MHLDRTLNNNLKKLIITGYKNGLLIALSEHGEIVELQYEEAGQESILGNIYVGRVEQVVKNIDATFLSFADGRMGYYSIKDNKCPYFLNPKTKQTPVQGDLLLVQVAKEAVKTKEPTLSSHISLTGRYAVLTVGNTHMSISGKIQDEEWKAACRNACRPYCTEEYGFIIRTNAYQLPMEEIIAEIAELSRQYEALKKQALYMTARSLVYQAPASHLKNLRDVYQEDLDEIITDDPEIFQEMKDYLKEQPQLQQKLSLYEDKLLSLSSLYSLTMVTERALKSHVWLKSGAYLVIEPTEALTVIDVNTGKCVTRKNAEETKLAINKESAKEIAKQLRLRNLSGIIIVDFINMDSKEAEKELLEYFSHELHKDPVKTYLAGLTNLGLAEVTRKKVKRPFREQLILKQTDSERD